MKQKNTFPEDSKWRLEAPCISLESAPEEDYSSGQEGNVGGDYQTRPCSTLKDSFSPLDSANPSSHCWVYA